MPEIGSLYVSLGLDTAQFDRQLPQTADKLKVVEKATGSLKFAVQNLGFQLNDIATSLASGSSPMRVLAQQGGQVVQAFQQGGGISRVLGAAATAARGLITPVTLAVGSFAALAAGLAVLVSRAVDSQSAVREFNVLLKGLGTNGAATGTGLEAAAKRLRDIGLSASEARDALIAAQRAGIAPNQAERVVRIGQNLVPVLGPNAPQTFISAIAGGVGPLGQLALQLGVVSEREVAAAQQAAQFGQGLQYLDRWVGLIEQHVTGLHREALSPVGQAFEDLRKKLADLLDAMANSKAIQFLVNRLRDIADTLTAIFSLRAPDWWNRLFGGGVVASAAIPSAASGSASSGGSANLQSLVQAIIKVESNGNPNAVSRAGAMGLMQLMPGTAQQYGVTDPFNAEQNIAGGTKYLQDLLAHYKGNVEYALMAYNWGQGNLDKALAGEKQIPSSVRSYANQVMGLAGTSTSGSVLARPNREQNTFFGTQEAEFRLTSEESRLSSLADRLIAAQYREGGSRAGAFAEAGAQATLETARRFGYDSSSDLAQSQARQRTLQLQDALRARTERQLGQQGAQDREQAEQLRLEASLQGKSTEEIQRQVNLLKVKQEAEKGGLDLSSEAVQNRLKEVNALADANVQLARQKELWGQLQEIGGVFENAVSQAFDNIANGTFKLSTAIRNLANDLLKTFASQAFKQLLFGNAGDKEGGIFGSLFGSISGGGGLLGLLGLGGRFSTPSSIAAATDVGSVATALGDWSALPKFASGGSFMVGGSGGIDSQLVAFNASPGEMVNVDAGRGSGGAGEPIRIELHPSEGWVSGIADQRVMTHAGQIVQISVKQSQKAVRQNFAQMSADTRNRSL